MTSEAEILAMFREDAAEQVDAIDRVLLAVEQGNGPEDAVDALFRHAHSIKGSAGMVGVDDAYTLSHSMENLLAQARRAGALDVALVGPLLAASDVLRAVVSGQADAQVVARVAGELDELAAAAEAEVGAAAEAADEGGDAAPEAAAPVPAPEPEPDREAPRAPEPRTMRVDAERVDRLLDAVGEAVGHQQRLRHAVFSRAGEDDEDATRLLRDGDRLLSDLKREAVELRMLPLTTITAPLGRAVRDLAAAEGKEVELVVTGDDTHLDRTVLEGMRECVAHLVRNAIAHGIESPEERQAAGKPPVGRLELRAEPRGERVAIEVVDDGRGVSPELVARVGPGRTLADVLTEPGLSTKRTVTAVAGRGVGLDAVRRHVESLRGTAEITSEPGRSTRVSLLLPLSLALMRVLLVDRGGQTFGIPLADVEEAIVVEDPTTVGGARSIVTRDGFVALVDLVEALDGSAPSSARPPAVVVRAGGERVAVLCDEIRGDREVLVKALGPLLGALPAYLGGAIEGDGSVVLIVGATHLVRHRGVRHEPSAADAARPVTLLVVDDQFTVRELQRSILEAAGFRVVTARTGREAWELLRGEPVDGVVTDIEMPEMDGLELLRAIRLDAGLRTLPVVVVTSRAGEDDERRGLEAGADAYIVKDRFDQQALLSTVRRLVAV